ncbi:MAG: adenylate/guanylate cyclase domain-containing protein, partial [Rhodospirillaceae bacterium]
EMDLILVKGKSEPTRIFELLSEAPAPDRFQEGLAAYRAQDWALAEDAFQSCAGGDDPVPAVFLGRIAHLKAEPPGGDWDGVWTFETK